VRYPHSMLQRLRHGIETQQLAAVDRLGVVNDVLSLCKAGFSNAAEALDVVHSYQNETSFTVWADLSSKMAELDTIVSSTDFYDQWIAFGRQLYHKIAQHVGWDAKPNEPHSTTLVRPLVLGRLGKYGDTSVVEEAKRRFDRYIADRNSLPADLRGVVYGLALRSHPEAYDQLLKLFRESDSQEEKVRITRSLGSSLDPALLAKTLDFALSAEVRSQDAVFVLGAVASNPKGRELAWQFIQNRWAELTKKYEGGFLLSRLVSLPSEFASEQKAKEVEEFFKAHPVAGAERTVRQTVETILSNAKWLARDGEHIKKWLQAHIKQ